ncbi:MAG TPA: hypothetical protein VGB92_20875 [Longimicrobium sp.]|jgi:hypothetical protein
MSDNRLPTEVELVYEVMPCLAIKSTQAPSLAPQACTYFHQWGTYHSYDYTMHGPPPTPEITAQVQYVGRAALVPEMLTGCRKAPVLAVGINPNLPGWWPGKQGSLNPLFDEYRQYAHYFRYRARSKLELTSQAYAGFGGGDHDQPPASGFTLDVPQVEDGTRPVQARLAAQKMYDTYQGLLDSLGEAMGWQDHRLQVGEDLSYGNMVACPSAKWTTRPDLKDPRLPPMTVPQRDGIVGACFRERKYFLRQLFQSFPSVILVFSQNTANAFIGELQDRFSLGDPAPGDNVEELMNRHVRLRYGVLPDGTALEARVVFAPHPTGNPQDFAPKRQRVIDQLVEEVQAGRLTYRPQTGHLARTRGACVFCTMLEIGPCDYLDELVPIAGGGPTLAADSSPASFAAEKAEQRALLDALPAARPVAVAWDGTDETDLDTSEWL